MFMKNEKAKSISEDKSSNGIAKNVTYREMMS